MTRSARWSPAALLEKALLAIPLATAVIGPLLAGSVRSQTGPLRPPGSAHPFGTDVLGRDVLSLALTGGTSVLLLAGGALLLAYLVGVPLALAAAGQRRRWVDESLLRALDVLLALPGLLILLVLAATGRQGPGALIVAVAVLQLPPVVRIARGAALAPGCRTAVEAMTMQGEPWWRIHFGYVARSVLAPVLVDAGSRLSLVLYLVASANFLGLGLAPSTSDWAVLVDRNQQALFLQPLAVVVPVLLLVALCTGVNLVADRALASRNGVRP